MRHLHAKSRINQDKLEVEVVTKCQVCGKQMPLLLKRRKLEEISPEELIVALNSDKDVIVGHLAEPQHAPDHEWNLDSQEKRNLLGELLRRRGAK